MYQSAPQQRLVPRRLIASIACLLILQFAQALAQPSALQQIRQLMKNNQFSAAMTQLQPLLVQGSEQIEAHLLKGVLEVKLGDVDAAINTFESLSQRHPKLPQAHNNLAAIYAAQGNFEKARSTLLRAINANPNYPVARENLGDLYASLAQISYQQALMRDRDNQQLADKMQHLVAITGKNLSVPEEGTSQPYENSGPAAARTSNPSRQKHANNSCRLLGPFESDQQRSVAQDWLGEQNITTEMVQQPHRRVRTMVFIPVDASLADAKASLAEIRSRGITDISLGRSKSGKRYISLGIFGKASSVERRIKELTKHGLAAQTEERTKTVKQTLLRASGGNLATLSSKQIRTSTGSPTLVIRSCDD